MYIFAPNTIIKSAEINANFEELQAATVNNPYCFRAYASATTTLTDGANVKIAFATEDYDYNNNFASSTYTTPIAGVYHFDASYILGTTATGVFANIKIYKNGAYHIPGGSSTVWSNVSHNISADLLLAPGDTIEIYGLQNSAGDENLDITTPSANFFSGHLVRATE